MNPLDLFNQVKELIENKDFSAAKTFVEENKDQLGEYLSQAQALVSGSEGLDGLVDKVKRPLLIIKKTPENQVSFCIFFINAGIC